MDESQTPRLAKMLIGLADFYRQPLSDSALRIYASCLAKYDIEELEQAARDHMEDPDRGRFMPKIADFVYAINGTADEAAAIAWDLAVQGRFPDPAAAEAIASMGGWSRAIGSRLVADQPFIAKEFTVRYKAFVRRQHQGQASIGLAEILKLNQGEKR